MPKKEIKLDAEREISLLSSSLHQEIRKLIHQAREHVAREYNSTQVLLNWMIGKRIDEEFFDSQRATYGDKVLENIANQLSLEYGRGYGKINLSRMLKLSRLFPTREIVSTLSKQLSWSHFVMVCAIDEPLKRDFYTEMCRIQHWSVRDFKRQMDGMLYERTVISKEPEVVIQSSIDALRKNDSVSSNLVFKDPYFISFIGSSNYRSERDLEDLILDNIVEFLQELGDDFCFVSRQKRMSTGRKDRYLDLLFFNRRLRRLIALDLKLNNFDPAYKGQMEWYLNWLDKNARLPFEEKPLGIILCAGKDQDDIEYLKMDQSGIHVAQYINELPSQELLEKKFYQAIESARESYARNIES
ncbi:MAG: PDDEXK nuclease domain-containing protein [Tatlockia sp.]|jgi:predicted nuclease of restriction endonuclease-like (RecB) superfamily